MNSDASALLAHDLLLRARAGDAAALEDLLRHCRGDLQRYARRHCESQDIDEAVQDALWILSRRVGALRAAAALSSWLFQVVRRLCLRMRVRAPKHVELPDEAPQLQHDERAAQELRIDLARVLSGMPAHYRDAVLLVDVLGHTAEEAAAQQGITVEAAKSRLHRARMMVRESFS